MGAVDTVSTDCQESKIQTNNEFLVMNPLLSNKTPAQPIQDKA